MEYLQVDSGPQLVGFPNDRLKTIVCPLSGDSIRGVSTSLSAVDADKAVAATVSAYVALGSSGLSYRIDACPDLPQTADALTVYVGARHGIGAADVASAFATPDGLQALTVMRWHYLLVMQRAYRDVERVVHHLAGAGVIGCAATPGTPSDSLSAIDFRAVILPAGYESVAGPFHIGDDAHTRRVDYQAMVEPQVAELARR